MSNDLNNVSLTGRLTKDPELKYVSDGKAVCSFSIANNEYYPGKENDNYGNFFNVIVWGKRAETMSKYLVKGSFIAIDGRLHQDRWSDQEGKSRNAVKIIANNIYFLSSSKSDKAKGSKSSEPSYPDFPKDFDEDNLIQPAGTEPTDGDVPF